MMTYPNLTSRKLFLHLKQSSGNAQNKGVGRSEIRAYFHLQSFPSVHDELRDEQVSVGKYRVMEKYGKGMHE